MQSIELAADFWPKSANSFAIT